MENYLEAENTADEDQHDEDQAHVTEGGDLLLVWEVIRLQRRGRGGGGGQQRED